MTDWRQIQARIRKARSSADPPGQLAALYERTRDAMVAFELAQIHEKSGAHGEAARWYTAAAERFRRAQWKQKAEEALTRLGASISVAPAGVSAGEERVEPGAQPQPVIAESREQESSEAGSEPEGGQRESVSEPPPGAPAAGPSGSPQSAQAVPTRRHRRRGRRGGRGRRKGPREGAQTPQAPAGVSAAVPATERAAESRAEQPVAARSAPEPASIFETAATGSLRGRAGDPALSSRMAQLESHLRRLLACPPHAVDEPEEAPAGPGVFLITDADQTSYYYVEACQTLRVGIGNLLRSGRGTREGANLKAKLAEHLGTNESRVAKYLKEHCAVRWLQLDEGAPLVAHFAVAVLRPVANQ